MTDGAIDICEILAKLLQSLQTWAMDCYKTIAKTMDCHSYSK